MWEEEGREREGRTIEVFTNHRELHIESKRVSASCIRFCQKWLVSGNDHKKRRRGKHTTLSSSYNI